MRKPFMRKPLKKLFATMLSAVLIATMAIPYATNAATKPSAWLDGVERVADENTMDGYDDALDVSTDTRLAGRVWTDKTVVASGSDGTGSLTLDKATDGVSGNVDFTGDFLHVYSAMGSGLQLKESVNAPVDLVILLDMSGSMGYDVTCKNAHTDMATRIAHSRINVVVQSVNKTIDELMAMNPSNRVAVVGYGASACTILELGHYTKQGSTDYITVEDFAAYGNAPTSKNFKASGSSSYTVHARAVRDGSNYEKRVRNDYLDDAKYPGITNIGYSTNMQAGLYVGFNELYKNATSVDSVTYTYNSEVYGKTTVPRTPIAFVMTDGASNFGLKRDNSDEAKGDEWYDVPIPAKVGTTWNSNYKMYRCETDQAGYGGREIILETLLTASFMKAKVEKKYNDLLSGATAITDEGSRHVDFQVNTVSVDMPDTKWQVPRIYAALDPATYFNKDAGGGTWDFVQDAKDAYAAYEQWLAAPDGGSITTQTYDSDHTKAKFPLKIGKLPKGGVGGITNEDVAANINYADTFANITAGALTDKFKELMGNINTAVFTPIAGINDLGVNNSVTYMDPMGEYMEVKDVKNMVLFGNQYNISKYAVYDRLFNEAHPGFREGWYDSDGNKIGSGDWSKGDVYRISRDTALGLLPDYDGNYAGNNKDKIDNTAYTFYQLDASGAVPNPCYGMRGKDYNITFDLSDVRIWVEDTGDYKDSTVEDSGIESGTDYEQALYIDVPGRSLPVRLAEVTLGTDGAVSDYIAEANGTGSMTPLRVFYTVGVADSILNGDKTDIDLAKVSMEYLEKHKDSDGKVSFYSNWFSGQEYSEGGHTQGDPAVTFSPSTSNRYYRFQKPMTLYAAGSSSKRPPEVKLGQYDEIWSLYPPVRDPSKVNADSWYYVLTDYFQKSGSGGKRMYVAVPVSGAELGLGLGSGSVSASDILCWYNPDTGETKELTGGTKGGNWVVAACKGGLKAGNLSGSVGAKGYGIGDSHEYGSKNNAANATGTAQDYYTPTVSQDSKVGKNEFVINVYLGNNGKLATYDTTLLVTKTVENGGSDNWAGADGMGFSYVLQMSEDGEGLTGDRYAVKTARNAHTGVWQSRIASVDVRTNNKGLLQDADGTLAVVDGCYVYVGGADGDEDRPFTYRVFEAKKDGSAKDGFDYVEDKTTGKTTYRVPKAYLVSMSSYDSDPAGWSFGGGTLREHLPVAVLNPANTIGLEIESGYDTVTAYQTECLSFTGGKAEFKLKNGEGLLLNGLDANASYRVSEALSDGQATAHGVTLKRLEHVAGGAASTYIPGPDGKAKRVDGSGSAADFDVTANTYSVSGHTTLKRDEAHYVNHVPDIGKRETVRGSGAYVKVGDTVEYDIKWDNDETDPNTGEPLPAKITVRDVLPDDIDLVEASYGGLTLKAGSKEASNGSASIACDEGGRGITWTIQAGAGAVGKVHVKAKVNMAVLSDHSISNQASVAVNSEPAITTNTVENPVTEKTETMIDGQRAHGKVEKDDLSKNADASVYTGPAVREGYIVSYEVSWQNCFEDKRDVTITDHLDENVEFASASAEGVEATAKKPSKEDGDVSVSYDKENHTVTWVLKDRKTGSSGKVGLSVRVLDSAIKAGVIHNTASVHVENSPAMETDRVDNPVKSGVGNLQISKTVKGPSGDKNKEFTFQLTLADENGDPLPGEYPYTGSKTGKIANGGTVKLKHGESVTVNGLPFYASYQVKELDFIPYTVEKSGAEGQVVEDGTAKAAYTNSLDDRQVKTETYPGTDQTVFEGNLVTYQIQWRNYAVDSEGRPAPATVKITDLLDKGLDYIGSDPEGAYDSAAHKVSWQINAKAGESGTVTVVARVNKDAVAYWDGYGTTKDTGEDDMLIRNRADVQVGNYSVQHTETVENNVTEAFLLPDTGGPGMIPIMAMAIATLAIWAGLWMSSHRKIKQT